MSSQNSSKNNNKPQSAQPTVNPAAVSAPIPAPEQAQPVAAQVPPESPAQQAQAILAAQQKRKAKKKPVHQQDDNDQPSHLTDGAADQQAAHTDQADRADPSHASAYDTTPASAATASGSDSAEPHAKTDAIGNAPAAGAGSDLILAQATMPGADANTGGMSTGNTGAATNPDMGMGDIMGGINPVAVAAGIAAIAIASSGGGGSASQTNKLGLSVTGGPILKGNNLQAVVYKVVNGKADTTSVLATGDVAEGGAVTIDLGSYTGLVKVVIQEKPLAAGITDQQNGNNSADDPFDFRDDLTTQPANIKQGVSYLTTYVNVGGSTVANVNHITSVISQLAERDLAQPVTSSALTDYNKKVAIAFGLTDANGNPYDLVKDIKNGAIGSVESGDKLAAANALLYLIGGGALGTGLVDEALITALSSGGDINSVPSVQSAANQLSGQTPSAFIALVASSLSATENAQGVSSFLGQGVTTPAGFTWKLGTGADSALFNINTATGALTFKAAPDYENPTSASKTNAYKVEISAVNAAGTASTPKIVTVNVANVDEAGPVFSSPDTARIAENVGTNQEVYTAVAVDNDFVGTASVTYGLKPGGDANAFTIDPQSGKVKLISNPDFETKSSYTFTVTATDGASPAHITERSVTLSITDVNEHTTPSSNQGAASATFVLTQAGTFSVAGDFTDPDPADRTRLTYILSGGPLPTGLTLNPATGIISGTALAETSAAVTFTITASDGVDNGPDASRVYSLSVVNKPTISSISVSDTTAPTNLGKGGDSVNIVVTTTEDVTFTSAISLTFQVGTDSANTFTGTLAVPTSAGHVFSVTSLGTLPAGNGPIKLIRMSGGTFAGTQSHENADNTLTLSVTDATYTVDSTAPNIAITGASAPTISLTSAGSAVTHDIMVGDKAVLTIPLGEAASGLTGLPTGNTSTIIKVNNTLKQGTWSTSGSNLYLTYTVAVGDNGAISVDNAALKSALASVTDLAGNAFTFGGSSTGVFNISNAAYNVDTIAPAAPTFSAISFTSTVATPASHTQTAFATLGNNNTANITLNDSGTNETLNLTLGTGIGATEKLKWSVDNGASWNDATPVGGTSTTNFTIAIPVDTANGTTTHTAKFHVTDAAGNSSPDQTATINVTHDNAAPTISSAVVNGNTLTLTFSEPLQNAAGLVPTKEDFSISGNTISSVSVSGSTVVLTLGTAYTYNAQQTGGTVVYTNGSDATDIQDKAGNEVAGFSRVFTNETPDIPALAASQPLNGVTNLDVTSKLVIPFNQNIQSLGTGHIKIIDDSGVNGWLATNTTKSTNHQEAIKNDIDITLTNGVVTDIKFGTIDDSAVGGVGLTEAQLTNSVSYNGRNLIIDIAPVSTPYSTKTGPQNTAWTFDWDFASNYHVVFDANIVNGANSTTNEALTDVNALKFTTVTPVDGANGANSKLMTDAGALTDGYIWHSALQGTGVSKSDAVSLDFSTGKHALVYEGEDYTDASPGVLRSFVGGNVKIFGFSNKDDIIYADNTGNMSLKTLEGLPGGTYSGSGSGGDTARSSPGGAAGGPGTVYIWLADWPTASAANIASAYGDKALEQYLTTNAVIFG